MEQKKPIYKKWWFIVLCAIVVVGVIGSALGGSDATDNDQASNSSESQAAEQGQLEESNIPNSTSTGTIDDDSTDEVSDIDENDDNNPVGDIEWYSAGMYKVGSDIPAGEYYIEATGMAYIQVSSDSTGNFDSIITNDNISTFSFVSVEDDQYFEVTRGRFVLASEIDPITSRGEGMYRVGIDIPAGEYKVGSTGGMGYLQVSSDSSGSFSSIVTNDNFEGEKYITVSDGQYLTLNRAEIIQ